MTDNVQEILSNPEIDVVFEAIVGEEPAYTYLSDAIEAGCHIITANKTMFATHGPALIKHAEFRNVGQITKQRQLAVSQLSGQYRCLLAADRTIEFVAS